MNKKILAQVIAGLFGAAPILATISQSAHASGTDITTSPLANRRSSDIKPNLMLILDDSGSMMQDYMPDSAGNNDPYGPGYRSYLCNTIYYNPTPTNPSNNLSPYLVPRDDTGAVLNSLSPATFTSAHDNGYWSYDQIGSASGSPTRTNLSTDQGWGAAYPLNPSGQGAYYWTYLGTNASSVTPSSGVCTLSSLGYGNYNTATGVCSSNATAPYTGGTYSIVTAANPTDANCGAGKLIWKKVVVSATSSPVSGYDERQRYANWYAYYRNRMQMVKSAIGRAFLPLVSKKKFRVGFITIAPNQYDNANSQTGVYSYSASTPYNSKFLEIRNFDTTDLATNQPFRWFNILYAQRPNGQTPLREGLSRVGRYYAGKNDGPNTGMIPDNTKDPVQYACQQNYSILTTDGYWDSPASSIGGFKLDYTVAMDNQDGNINETDFLGLGLAIGARPVYDGAISSTVTTTDAYNQYQNIPCTYYLRSDTQILASTSQPLQRTSQVFGWDRLVSATTNQKFASTVQERATTNQKFSWTTQPLASTVQRFYSTRQEVANTNQLVTYTRWVTQNTTQLLSSTSQLRQTTNQIRATTNQRWSNTIAVSRSTSQLISKTSQILNKTTQPLASTSQRFASTSQLLSSTAVQKASTVLVQRCNGVGAACVAAATCTPVAEVTTCSTTTSGPTTVSSCTAGVNSSTWVTTTCATSTTSNVAAASCTAGTNTSTWVTTTCATSTTSNVATASCTAGTNTSTWVTTTCATSTVANSPAASCTAGTNTSTWVTTTCSTSTLTVGATACTAGTNTSTWVTTTCSTSTTSTGVNSCTAATNTSTWVTTTCSTSTTANVAAASCAAGTNTSTWVTTTCATSTATTGVTACTAGTNTAGWITTTCSTSTLTTGVNACTAATNTSTWVTTTCSTSTTANVAAASCAAGTNTSTWVTTTCATSATGPSTVASCAVGTNTSTWVTTTCATNTSGQTGVSTCTASTNTSTWVTTMCATLASSTPTSLCVASAASAGNSWVATTCATNTAGPTPTATCTAGTNTSTWTTTTCSTSTTSSVPAASCAAGTNTSTWVTTTCSTSTTASAAASSCSASTNTATWVTTVCSTSTLTQGITSCSAGTNTSTWVTTTCSTSTTSNVMTASCAAGTNTSTWVTTTCATSTATNGVAACSASTNTSTWVTTTCATSVAAATATAACSPATNSTTWVTSVCSTTNTGPTGVSTCSPGTNSTTWVTTTCSTSVTTNVPAASCTAGTNTSTWVTTTCDSTSSPSNTTSVVVQTCTAASATASNSYVSTACVSQPGSKNQYQTKTQSLVNRYSDTTVVGSTSNAWTAYSAWTDMSLCLASVPSLPANGRPDSGDPATPAYTSFDAACTAWPCVHTDNNPVGGSSNSLADVAQYYYKTDLRPTGATGQNGLDVSANIVPTSATDTTEGDMATWQHMTTFTMGLGVSGNIAYNANYKNKPVGSFTSGVPNEPFQKIRCQDASNANLADPNQCLNWPVPSAATPSAVDDLWHAAVNGRGQYFSAADPDTVYTGLQTTLQAISAQTGAGTGATTSTQDPVAGNDLTFNASFRTVDWTGDIQTKQMYTGTDLALEGTTLPGVVWSAQAKLDGQVGAACDSRTIYLPRMGVTNNMVPFTWNTYACDSSGLPTGAAKNDINASEKNYLSSTAASTYASPFPMTAWSQYLDMTDGTNGIDQRVEAQGAKLLNFLRGQRGGEGFVSGSSTQLFRTRVHVLGDIVTAQPRYVAPPAGSFIDMGYAGYKAIDTIASRPKMLYVGANDGMLHAIRVGTDVNDNQGGTEAWALIPTAVLPNLYRLADTGYAEAHTYYVDSTPKSADVYDKHKTGCDGATDLNVAKTCWKTVLVGGLGAGGRGYYAMDVTDPTAPKTLWEFNWSDTCYDPSDATTHSADCHIGLTFGEPLITKIYDGVSEGTWVVLVTSGVNNVNTPAKAGDGVGYLYVLDAITGKILKKISTGAGDATTPSGFSKINSYVENYVQNNLSLRVYGGDMLGNVWRITLPQMGNLNYDVVRLTKVLDPSGNPQPITTTPQMKNIGALNTPLVYVATGRYLGETDLSDTQTQTVYGIPDNLNYDSTSAEYIANGNTVLPSSGNTLRQQLNQVVLSALSPSVTTTRVAADPVCVATTIDPTQSCSGWYVDLPDAGERVSVDMRLVLGSLVVPSNVTNLSACDIGGNSWFNVFDASTGGEVANNPFHAGTYMSGAVTVGMSIIRGQSGRILSIVTKSTGEQEVKEVKVQQDNPLGKHTSWRDLSN